MYAVNNKKLTRFKTHFFLNVNKARKLYRVQYNKEKKITTAEILTIKTTQFLEQTYFS